MEVSIVTSSTKTNLVIVLEFCLVWGVLLEVDHLSDLGVRSSRESFGLTKSNSFVGIEGSSEFITVINTEDSGVEFDVHGKLKVRPVVAFSRFSILGDFVALEEDTLGKSSVLLSVLDQMKGIIFKVVHHSNVVYAEVFIR